MILAVAHFFISCSTTVSLYSSDISRWSSLISFLQLFLVMSLGLKIWTSFGLQQVIDFQLPLFCVNAHFICIRTAIVSIS